MVTEQVPPPSQPADRKIEFCKWCGTYCYSNAHGFCDDYCESLSDDDHESVDWD